MDQTSRLSPSYLAEDNSAPLLGTCIFFLVLESIFIGLLYISRFLAKDQKVNLSMTMLMTAGFFTCVAKITLGILIVKIGGAGRHLLSLPPTTITHMLQILTALQIVCPLTTSITKLGILSLFYQLLGRTSNHYRLAIKSSFALVLCILIVQVVIPFTNCKPFSYNWEPYGSGSCAIPGLSLWRYLSVPNIFTTIIMIGIPIPALYNLHVSAPTRFGLGIIFSVCVVGIVAAIMRFDSFLKVADFTDISYETIKPLCWTIAESGIYLVAGVMPTLRPLVRKVCGDIKFDGILSRSFRISESWGTKRGGRVLVEGEKTLPRVPGDSGFASEIEGKGGESVRTDRKDEEEQGLVMNGTR